MTGAELAGPVAEEIIRLLPKGFALLRSWWAGKEILIVGQARAGKTTFREYLQYGLFDDEKPTDETSEIEPTGRFDVGIGQRGALKLSVRSAIDSPGQAGAVAHANLAFEQNPHALLIVLDLTAPLDGQPDRASGAWLKRFCKRYEAKWRVDRKRKNHLKVAVVIMSKADKIDAADAEARRNIIEAHRNAYREILEAELREARGRMLQEIAVIPCSMVTNTSGTKLMDGVIAHLAKAVSRK